MNTLKLVFNNEMHFYIESYIWKKKLFSIKYFLLMDVFIPQPIVT